MSKCCLASINIHISISDSSHNFSCHKQSETCCVFTQAVVRQTLKPVREIYHGVCAWKFLKQITYAARLRIELGHADNFKVHFTLYRATETDSVHVAVILHHSYHLNWDDETHFSCWVVCVLVATLGVVVCVCVCWGCRYVSTLKVQRCWRRALTRLLDCGSQRQASVNRCLKDTPTRSSAALSTTMEILLSQVRTDKSFTALMITDKSVTGHQPAIRCFNDTIVTGS